MAEAISITTIVRRADVIDRCIAEIEDRTAIHRLLVDLQTAVDDRDAVRSSSFFTEDGEWRCSLGEAKGQKQIADHLKQYGQSWPSESERSYHSLSDIVIDIAGSIGTVRGLWRHDVPADDGRPVTDRFGRFEAVVQRTPQGWRIKCWARFPLLPYLAPNFPSWNLESVNTAAEKSAAQRNPQTEAAGEPSPSVDVEHLRDRTEALRRRVRKAEDRDAIHRLFLDVQSAMDEREMVQYGQLYTADGEWCAVNGRAVGPAQITKHLEPYCRPWASSADRTYHSISDVTIDVDGDRAVGHAQWQHTHPDEHGHPIVKAFGHFEAVADRTPDGWRLRRRASYLKIPYIEPKYQLVGLPDLEREAHQRAQPSSPAAEQKAATQSREDTLPELSNMLDDLELRCRQVEDRAAIYRLFIELQDATDTRDGTRYGLCFTEDGEWSGVTGRASGQAEIAKYMSDFMTPWESEESRTFHSISDLTIDLAGDSATARAQYRHYKLGDDGRPAPFHFCHYEAILRRTSAGWRFKRRDSFMDIPYHEPRFQLSAQSGKG